MTTTSPIVAARDAFLKSGGTDQEWEGGVKRAVEAEIRRVEAESAVQQAIDAAVSTHDDRHGSDSPVDRAYRAMRGKISI